MAKYEYIARLLENRIRHGDYLLKEVPSERELALEAQVSHMTARKAILHLVDKGLLVRRPNRRLAVRRDRGNARKQVQIALLSSPYPNPYLELWHLWLNEMARERECFVRVIGYCHWDDAVILDTIEGFDGTFLLPLSDQIPLSLIRRIKQAGRPVVILGQDTSEHGIPSLRITSPSMVQKLLDHLGGLGHRHVDCLNTQPPDQVIRARIDQWQLWLAAHGGTGTLFDEPVRVYHSPIRGACETVRRLLDAGELKPNAALFCVTTSAALGALRAIYEKGLKAGKDISVCSAEDGADVAPYLTPALTCLRDRDPKPYLGVCVDWILRGGENWVGPLAVQPADAMVFEGETTGRR
ncbi:MAG: LacI family transcriptional regulator [Phycisphaerae bacterium]|nr:LacI family transcriptional regulator [Phycisphaerae bacterium]